MKFGGACAFVHHDGIYLNSTHETATPQARRRLMAQWSKHWDLKKPILLEKSPPTLVQLDYRNYLFPNVSANIVVVRHPLYICFVKRAKDKLTSESFLKCVQKILCRNFKIIFSSNVLQRF